MWTCPKCGEKIENQFDSCWKCAAEPKQTDVSTHRLTWLFFILAVPMAILAPLLADTLQSLSVFPGGISFERVWWYLVSTKGACLFVGVRAIITYLVLWFFVRLGFRDRTVWICLAILWFIADCMFVELLTKPRG